MNFRPLHSLSCLPCWRVIAAAAVIITLSAPVLRAESHLPILRFSTGNLPPVSTPERDGYLNNLLVALFARVGYGVEIIDLPQRRAIRSADQGHHDGNAARLNMMTSRFRNLRLVEPAIIKADFVGLYLNKDIEVNTAADFKKYSVGYIRGWRIAESLFEDHPNTIAASSADNLIKMLKANRIDVAYLTRVPGQYYADKHGVDDLQFSTYLDQRDLFIHLNARHSALLPMLRTALAEMHRDGTYADIMQGYLSK